MVDPTGSENVAVSVENQRLFTLQLRRPNNELLTPTEREEEEKGEFSQTKKEKNVFCVRAVVASDVMRIVPLRDCEDEEREGASLAEQQQQQGVVSRHQLHM